MDWLGSSIFAVIFGGVALGAWGYHRLRRRRELRDTAALAAARDRQLHIPSTLHPVIDPEICMGSMACIAACPEGDILGLVEGRAALINASACIGHGRCAAECPVGAIRLVFGTSERAVDLPELDGDFESSRPGLHIVGELGGMGLIKNAVRQGIEVGEALAKKLGRSRASPERADVAIIGAGPAGIAAAASCQAEGLSYRVLEQEKLGGTVANYPRHKIVMTEKVEIPGYGPFGRRSISKEELLESMEEVLERTGVRVDERVRVESIDGEDGDFSLTTSAGEVRAKKIILAMGRRGTPKKLGVPGEELPKVSYRLIEPEQYAGARVLVVGGGDSALEAAITLAEESDAAVALSYRNPEFGRCRPQNKQKIEALIASGRVQALMSSNVVRIEVEKVLLRDAQGNEQELANDYVIIAVGGTLPSEFLQKNGVAVDRHFGDVEVKRARFKRSQAHAAAGERGDWLALGLTLIGLGILALLTMKGWQYYRLPLELRRDSPLHDELRPAGFWGHGIGVVATAVMLMNFLYAARKRVRLLGHFGALRSWLTFHVFVGIMSPLVIAFHAAFQSNNLLATATAAALMVVVGTGLFGRFVFGLIPTEGGRLMPREKLEANWKELGGQLGHSETDVTDVEALRAAAKVVTDLPEPGGSLLFMLLSQPLRMGAARLRVRRVRRLFAHAEAYRHFRSAYLMLSRARLQIAFYGRLRRMLGIWRLLHVTLSAFLVLVIALHIALSLYLGYGWILF